MTIKQRDLRLTARVDHETQHFVAQAADFAGMTVSQFLIEAAREKAIKINEQMTRIHVSNEAADRIMRALDEPPEPNALLQRALTRRQELMTDDVQIYPNNERSQSR